MKQSLEFENLDMSHMAEVMSIFNYYVENSYAAYAEMKMPDTFFSTILEMTKGYPAYIVKVNDKVAGFCFIRAYNPFPAFSETA